MNNNIIENIKNKAREIAQQKIENERKLTEERILLEEKTIKDLCEKINSGFWVKRIGDNSSIKYEVATIEEFEKDFFKTPEYNWQKGLIVVEEFSFKINGAKYFHIGKLWEFVEKEIRETHNRIDKICRDLRETEEKKESLSKSFNALKNCLSNYERLKKIEEQEPKY